MDDYHWFLGDAPWGFDEAPDPEPVMTTCRHCGADHLYWALRGDRWRLWGASRLHECDPAAVQRHLARDFE